MPALHVLVPGDLQSRTGGYGYDRRIIEGLRALGWTLEVHALGEGYPFPDDDTRRAARDRLAALPAQACVLVDGLGFGVLPDELQAHAGRLRLIALVHHPLAFETGLSEAARATLFEQERAALRHARLVIVTSRQTARDLAAFGVEPSRIVVVEPGTEPMPLATGSGSDVPNLLCVASLTPRKAHADLLAALDGLREQTWMLHLAGGEWLDPDCAVRLRGQVRALGLDARVVFHGERDAAQLLPLYRSADLFVLPSLHEGFGMALAEALACGLPVISTTAGAIPDTVPADAGWLVPPGDVPALRAALREALGDPAMRERKREGARQARDRLVAWPTRVEAFARALGTVKEAG